MWRFVLRQNIVHLRSLIAATEDDDGRRHLEANLADLEQELEALEEASHRADGAHSPLVSTLLTTVLRREIVVNRADFGTVQFIDRATATLRFAAQVNLRQSYLDRFATEGADDDTASGRALRTGRSVWIEDVRDDPSYVPHLEVAAETGYRALQCIPLLAEREVFGTVSLLYRLPRTWTVEEKETNEGAARMLAWQLWQLKMEGVLR